MEVLYRQAESKTPAHFGRDFYLFRLTLDQTAAAFFFLGLPGSSDPFARRDVSLEKAQQLRDQAFADLERRSRDAWRRKGGDADPDDTRG